jgi:hypothetical protein
MTNHLKKRVEARLKALGLTAITAATRPGIGLQRDFIDNIIKEKKRTVKGNNLAKLAQALETTSEWLMSTNEIDLDQAPVTAFDVDKNKNVIKIRFVARANNSRDDAPGGDMGFVFVGEHRFSDLSLFGVKINDESADGLYPPGATLLVAETQGPGSRLPTAGNPVVLKIRLPDGSEQITARRLERVGNADVFASLEKTPRLLPALFAPDATRDKWQVLGQVMAHGFWPDPVEGGQPIVSLGNLDED